jgi:hypothetical protein
MLLGRAMTDIDDRASFSRSSRAQVIELELGKGWKGRRRRRRRSKETIMEAGERERREGNATAKASCQLPPGEGRTVGGHSDDVATFGRSSHG